MLTFEVIDVANNGELPEPPDGQRFLDFFGGPLGHRVYVVPSGLSRSEFMSAHPDLLHPSLEPVYDHGGITVRQDPTWPVPGFFVVVPDDPFHSIDEMPPSLHLRMSNVVRQLRYGVRHVLGIGCVHHNYVEKESDAFRVHEWMVPLYPEALRRMSLTSSDPQRAFQLGPYLAQFRFPEQEARLIESRNRISTFFALSNTAERDDELAARLSGFDPPANDLSIDRLQLI